jgi:histidinol-phosphate aminotransferase
MAAEKTAPEPRPAISQMHPYEWEPPSASIARQAGVPEDQVVRFDTNTFPWPGATLDRLRADSLNEYPDTSYSALTEAIAQYTDVPGDRITVGAGADEILDLIAKAYIDGTGRVVLSRPTYPMFRILTEMAGGSVDEVPAVDLRLNRAAFLEQARRARLTWICNPNNPTGELLPLDLIEEVAASTAGVVAVDEAYFEVSGVTSLPLTERWPNVVIVRTLSKAFGLAGVRVGYALAGAAISAALRRVRPPGSISVVSAALGVQALSGLDGMRQRVQKVKEERVRLQRELAASGFEVRDSAANFLLVRTGRALAPLLLASGLVVRTFPATSPLADYIRITVRKPEENARLIVALKRSLRVGTRPSPG